MKVLIACVEKDIRLFFSRKTGVAVLVLPLLLLAALLFGTGDLFASSSYVEPFPFAVRDEDNSYVSRSLVAELRDIEIFSSVDRIKDPERTDAELFSEGYAAVMILPEDYFYSMYDMENLHVTVSLNPDMPAEAAIVRTLIASVTDIVSAEQKAWLAEYGVRAGGELSREDYRELWYESANHELIRALKRGQVFASVSTAESFVSDRLTYAYASVSALLCMLLPLCVLKGIPEERRLNILQRYRSIRRSSVPLYCARFFAALILFLLPETVLTVLLGRRLSLTAVLGILGSFFAAYAFFSLLSALPLEAARLQTGGNVLIVVSLLLGGAIYPYVLLPDWAQHISGLTLPYRLTNALSGDRSSAYLLFAAAFVFAVLALLLERRYRRC